MKHETKTQADIHLLGGFDYNINRETKTGTCLCRTANVIMVPNNLSTSPKEKKTHGA